MPAFPVVDCGDPGTPTNGQLTLTSTTYNSVVTYTCNMGYTLQGSNSRTCQSNGNWSGNVTKCSRKLESSIKYVGSSSNKRELKYAQLYTMQVLMVLYNTYMPFQIKVG